ncbi:M23 family metallopeptidase [Streptomyces sp. ZYX-F-203]
MRRRRRHTGATLPALTLIMTVLPALFVGLGARPSEPTAAGRPAPSPGSFGDDASVPALGVRRPVDTSPPVILRGWEPPATPYAAGHRGVDLAAPPGTPVRAVAAGRVSFAGRVGGRGAVSVELAGSGNPPLRTTYLPVRPSVANGRTVAAGDVVGTIEPDTSRPAVRHCPRSCLHWGLRRGDAYLDPLLLMPPGFPGTGPSRLLPIPEPGAPGRGASR